VIFLDANIFLRYLDSGNDKSRTRMQELARSVFWSLDAGRIDATTSEVVLHEVCYVLTSKRHYGLSARQAIQAIEPILRMRSLKFPPGDREIYLRALAIWLDNPVLEFSDSTIAARCESNSWELATFDRHFNQVSGLTLWKPSPSS
jgi:predicted nucleic acid-binding protein